MSRFLKTAIPEVTCHAVGFVGRLLEGDPTVPPDVIERFEALWDFYWADRGSEDARQRPNDWLFGPWFSCGKFRNEWSLDRLEQFVDVNPTPEPDHAIAERLAIIADSDLAKSVRILDKMVRGDREGWRIQSWRDSAMKVLGQAMRSDGDARSQAIKLIDFLGRRGYLEFGELLR
jgi:hypothetical protein